MILSKEYLERYKKLELLQIISDAMELNIDNNYQKLRFNVLLENLYQPTPIIIKASIERIIKKVGNYHNLPKFYFINKTRKREYVDARQQAMYFMRSLKMSYASIGKLFNRNHATVMHAIKTVNNLLVTDFEYRIRFVKLERLLNIDSKAVKYLNENID